MNLYERFRSLRLSADDYLDQLVSIKSELFLAFAGFISARHIERYPELLRAFVRCEIISDELERSENVSPPFSYAYWYLLHTALPEEQDKLHETASRQRIAVKYRMRDVLLDLLLSQVRSIERYIALLDSESLKDDINRLLEPFVRHTTTFQTAEER